MTMEPRADRLRTFQEARFGMFIHWGLYAIPARGEWVQFYRGIPGTEYEAYARQFDPKKWRWPERPARVPGLHQKSITTASACGQRHRSELRRVAAAPSRPLSADMINHPPRFLTLWAINGPLDRRRLFDQLEQFARHGLDGVVWHPRFYPGEPPYLESAYLDRTSQVILRARDLDLAFWIYDEDGWPSGAAGGRMLRTYPEEIQRSLALTQTPSDDIVHAFRIGGDHWYLEQRQGPGVDYLSPTLSTRFLALTHERYRQGLDPAAFAHVEAFFCDEPEFGLAHLHDRFPPAGAVPWTPTLPELYLARYGRPLEVDLPGLFFDQPGFRTSRQRFWELLSDVFAANFLRPINTWCASHGKLFTAHLKGEEHPYFQVPNSGSADRSFRELGMPGVDALERGVGNDYYPRQAVTASRQFSDGRTMVEAFGGSGWGSAPTDLEQYLRWLGGTGITDFVLHLCQYRLDSAALLDWPPSHPLHITWSPAYHAVLDRVRRVLAEHPRPPADVLLISPHRAIMAEYHPAEWPLTNVNNASVYPDSPAGRINRAFMDLVQRLRESGINYDVVDERTLATHVDIKDDRFTLGRATYRRLIVAPFAQLEPALAQRLAPFALDPPPRSSTPATSPAPAEPQVALTPRWRLARPVRNTLVLEPTPAPGGWYRTIIHSALSDATPVGLLFADQLDALAVDGTPTSWTNDHLGSRATTLLPAGPGETSIDFQPRTATERPFVWANGDFLAINASSFTPTANRHVQRSSGPFVLHDPCPTGRTLPDDLLDAGFVFLREPLHMSTDLTLEQPATALLLSELVADAARVSVDGHDLGWTWGESSRLPVDLGAGAHHVSLELIPNSYNVYGPHHYVLGDAPAISPAQMEGHRNFIDESLPLASTHKAAWHLRRFQVPRLSVSIGSAHAAVAGPVRHPREQAR